MGALASFLQIVGLCIASAIAAVILFYLLIGLVGVVVGVFRAAMRFSYYQTINRLNKRGGARFLVVTGSPEVVEQVHEIVVQVLGNVEKKQAERRALGLSDEDTNEPKD